MSNYDEDETCENCFIELAEVTNDGLVVCRICDKDLKRQARKAENKRRKREEREDAILTHKNYRGGK